MKPAAFYVPIELDPALLPPDLREYGHCFLNHLHWRWVCWSVDGAGFAHVMWKFITRVIPRPVWPRIRTILTDTDHPGGPVVERDYRVAWGRKAEGFRLARPYRRVHRLECADERLNLRIRQRSAERDLGLRPVHHRLRAHLNRIEFDHRRAAALIEGLDPDPDRTGLGAEEYRAVLSAQCQRLADGEWSLVPDQFGRVHTPITSLPRALRPCLYVGGRPLVGLDLANSQPLVAGLLARWCLRSKDARYRLCRATFPDTADPYRRVPLDGLGRVPGEPADLTEYIRVCAAGRFYEEFIGPGRDRDRVKHAFMPILMGPNRYQGPVKTAFEDRFPTVAGMLRALKRKEHARAAWLLQNLEAALFIGAVCGRLTEEYPELPLYTVHDSLFTTSEGLSTVRTAILAAFGRVGVTPTLKYA